MGAHEFAAFAQELSRSDCLQQTGEQVVDHARTGLGADHGGITLPFVRSGPERSSQ
jgi:hypothetical protein